MKREFKTFLGITAIIGIALLLDKLFPFHMGEVCRADPVTIITVALTAISTIGGIVSSVRQSSAQESAERKNERMMQYQAQLAREAAEQRAGDYESRAKAALAMERTQRAISGIEMEGSPLLTYFENARQYREDVERIRKGGEIEATGWMLQAKQHGAYARAAGQTGYTNIGKTLLTGATDIFRQGKAMGWWGNAPNVTSSSYGGLEPTAFTAMTGGGGSFLF